MDFELTRLLPPAPMRMHNPTQQIVAQEKNNTPATSLVAQICLFTYLENDGCRLMDFVSLANLSMTSHEMRKKCLKIWLTHIKSLRYPARDPTWIYVSAIKNAELLRMFPPTDPKLLKKCFLAAAECGNTEALSTLITMGVDVQARDSLGHTVLMLAAIHDQPAITRTFLSVIKQQNAKAVAENTPLKIIDIHSFLNERSFTDFREGVEGETALMIARNSLFLAYQENDESLNICLENAKELLSMSPLIERTRWFGYSTRLCIARYTTFAARYGCCCCWVPWEHCFNLTEHCCFIANCYCCCGLICASCCGYEACR